MGLPMEWFICVYRLRTAAFIWWKTMHVCSPFLHTQMKWNTLYIYINGMTHTVWHTIYILWNTIYFFITDTAKERTHVEQGLARQGWATETQLGGVRKGNTIYDIKYHIYIMRNNIYLYIYIYIDTVWNRTSMVCNSIYI